MALRDCNTVISVFAGVFVPTRRGVTANVASKSARIYSQSVINGFCSRIRMPSRVSHAIMVHILKRLVRRAHRTARARWLKHHVLEWDLTEGRLAVGYHRILAVSYVQDPWWARGNPQVRGNNFFIARWCIPNSGSSSSGTRWVGRVLKVVQG
jgi:hypothetical protein